MKIIILGAGGRLGAALLREYRDKFEVTGFNRTQLDRAFLINAEAPRVLAEICGEKSARLIHFSTDYVFDGEKREPYSEEDEATPISVYGESKLAGEKNVLAAQAANLVVRVSWVFGPDRPSFVDAMIRGVQESERIDAVADKFSTPTYTLDIAEMLGGILDGWSLRAPAPEGVARFQGILHFANAG